MPYNVVVWASRGASFRRRRAGSGATVTTVRRPRCSIDQAARAGRSHRLATVAAQQVGVLGAAAACSPVGGGGWCRYTIPVTTRGWINEMSGEGQMRCL